MTRMKAGQTALALATDAIGLIGAALLIAGIDMISRPAALIVAGLMLLTVSVLAARRT